MTETEREAIWGDCDRALEIAEKTYEETIKDVIASQAVKYYDEACEIAWKFRALARGAAYDEVLRRRGLI